MIKFKFLFLGISFKDPISPLFEQLDFFHDESLKVLVFMSILMMVMILTVWFCNSFSKIFLEKKFLEMFWTLIPSVMLMILALPSLSLLYYLDMPFFQTSQVNMLGSLIKVVGNQWFWGYEYFFSWGKNLIYDSFLLPLNEMSMGGFRLLEVDKPLVLNCFSNNLIQGLSQDVIHSWTCPSFGMKFDVLPGRLKSSCLLPIQMGSFFGQCSEICGAKHSFMPMEIEVLYSEYV